MEIRHPLPGSAAELADVVPGGAAGYQRQVHGHPGLLQLPAHGYGNVMHPRYMLQSPEGCHLQPQAHHFIDIFPLPQPQHLLVERSAGTLLQLLSADEREIVHGVKGQYIPLHSKKHLQNRQEKHRPGSAGATDAGLLPKMGRRRGDVHHVTCVAAAFGAAAVHPAAAGA